MTQRKKQNTPKPEPVERKMSKKDYINSLVTKKIRNKFLTESQKTYYDLLTNNQIVLCSGPAGVGKSYISMKAAVDLLLDPTNSYEKLVIVRPAVEAEEKLGSLPGNVEEKLDPYIFPSYYLLNKIVGKEAREKLLTRIGYNSKFFISGDLEQTDRYKDKRQSGLWDALQRFKSIDDVGVFEFSDKDVVRNPLISKLLKRYEE